MTEKRGGIISVPNLEFIILNKGDMDKNNYPAPGCTPPVPPHVAINPDRILRGGGGWGTDSVAHQLCVSGTAHKTYTTYKRTFSRPMKNFNAKGP